MISISDKLRKTAQLVAPNKDTVLHLFNHYDEEEYYKILAPGFTRIQDYVDCLNENPYNDFEVLGWEYRYYDPELCY